MFSRSFEALRVTPNPAPYRRTFVLADDMVDTEIVERDDTSSWSCQILYRNDRGEESERTITCKRLYGYGGVTHVDAFCHSRERPRSFRIDHILELFDIKTGELLHAESHFEMLRTVGALPFEDRGFSAFVQIATFMAKCDGEYHPMEVDALEAAVTAYALRFGGDDRQIAVAMDCIPRIAPDGVDVAKAVKRLKASPIGGRVSRLILDHCGQIMNADGRHHAQEVAWAVELGSALKGQASGLR